MDRDTTKITEMYNMVNEGPISGPEGNILGKAWQNIKSVVPGKTGQRAQGELKERERISTAWDEFSQTIRENNPLGSRIKDWFRSKFESSATESPKLAGFLPDNNTVLNSLGDTLQYKNSDVEEIFGKAMKEAFRKQVSPSQPTPGPPVGTPDPTPEPPASTPEPPASTPEPPVGTPDPTPEPLDMEVVPPDPNDPGPGLGSSTTIDVTDDSQPKLTNAPEQPKLANTPEQPRLTNTPEAPVPPPSEPQVDPPETDVQSDDGAEYIGSMLPAGSPQHKKFQATIDKADENPDDAMQIATAQGWEVGPDGKKWVYGDNDITRRRSGKKPGDEVPGQLVSAAFKYLTDHNTVPLLEDLHTFNSLLKYLEN